MKENEKRLDKKNSKSADDMEVDQQAVVSRVSTGSFEPIISREPAKLTQESQSAKDEGYVINYLKVRFLEQSKKGDETFHYC